jgi:tRNA(Ile)-lysidine synthase
MVQSVYDFCVTRSITSCRILLGVSGGSDSVGMMHCFLQLRGQLHLDLLGIAHVNHGLRGAESDDDEHFVRDLALRNTLPCYCTTIHGKNRDDAGVEAWARRERYAFFSRIRQEHRYTYIATAHTADDQAETILMRIVRGTGIQGLQGIHPVRKDGVIRPLLGVRKHSIEAWLKQYNHPWRSDSSNKDLNYERNFFRHTIVPMLIRYDFDAVKHIAAVADHIQGNATITDALIETWLSKNLIYSKTDDFAIRKPEAAENQFFLSECFVRLLRDHDITFTKKQIEQLLLNCSKTHGQYLLPDFWSYYPGREQIVFLKKGPEKNIPSQKLLVEGVTPIKGIANPVSISVSAVPRGEKIVFDPGNTIVFLDAGKCGKTLLCRPIAENDLFYPLGHSGSTPAAKYLKKKKVAAFYRNNSWVVTKESGEILWIPGVEVSEQFKITSETEAILKFSWI